MEGAIKMADKFFGWIVGILGSLLGTFVMYQYTSVELFKKETRSDIAAIKTEALEKFVLKTDYQYALEKLYKDNREDHQLLFKEIKELREKLGEMQTMILKEIRK